MFNPCLCCLTKWKLQINIFRYFIPYVCLWQSAAGLNMSHKARLIYMVICRQVEPVKINPGHKSLFVTDLRVQRVWGGNIQDRRQLLQPLGPRVSAWWHRLDSVGYRQWDGPQFVENVFLHGQIVERWNNDYIRIIISINCFKYSKLIKNYQLDQSQKRKKNHGLLVSNLNKTALLTWSWKTAVVHTGCCCWCNSTSSVCVYSGSRELRPRKLTRCGRPNFLRSVSASKCTTRAWWE